MEENAEKRPGSDAGRQLRRPESSLSVEAAQIAGVRELDQLKVAIAAARAYARSVAGENKVKFIHAFQMALHIGVAAVTAEANDDSIIKRELERGVPLVQEKFYANTIFVENALRWIEDDIFIFGGVETDGFPDCVAVGKDSDWCCSGTLIAPKVVLTAGHCYGCASQVFIGKRLSDGGRIIPATPVRHPLYDPSPHHNNDLTILFLEQETQGVTPRQPATADMIEAADQVWIVGFGNNNAAGTTGKGIKRVAKVPIVSHRCTAPDSLHYDCNQGVELVAMAPAHDRDSCVGDSGGPAYIKSQPDGELFLAGVTSRPVNPKPSSRCGDGGIYVRVDIHEEWIRTCVNGGPDACRKWRPAP